MSLHQLLVLVGSELGDEQVIRPGLGVYRVLERVLGPRVDGVQHEAAVEDQGASVRLAEHLGERGPVGEIAHLEARSGKTRLVRLLARVLNRDTRPVQAQDLPPASREIDRVPTIATTDVDHGD